jgi:hypothetical protein
MGIGMAPMIRDGAMAIIAAGRDEHGDDGGHRSDHS